MCGSARRGAARCFVWRRAEVVALDLADYTSESGELKIRSGKGYKGRLCYAGENCREALSVWLEVRGEQEGPLFLPLSKGRPPRGGQLLWRRLGDQAVMDIRPLAKVLEGGADALFQSSAS